MKIAILTMDNREHFRDYANPVPYFGTAPEALLQGFSELPEAEVHVISCLRQPVNAPEKIADNIWYHALHVPKMGWMRTLFQGCIRATRKKLREIQPDIVHGQGTEGNNALCAVFSGFPNVITIHGNMRLLAALYRVRPFSYNWLAAKLETFTLPRTDGVVCITHYTRNAVADLAKRTWLLPNAVDKSFFYVQSTPDFSAPPIGLCTGVICHRKNQNAFIRALDPLAKKTQFQIIFLGQIEKNLYSDEFLKLVKERPWCKYHGWAGREELKKYLKTAAFLALPTLEDNCPMVVLEAMAAGVPVIASCVGGVPDLIEAGKTGLFCNPQNAANMSGTVEKLLEEPELGRMIASDARHVAAERFHPMAVARRHLEIYREVLGKHS